MSFWSFKEKKNSTANSTEETLTVEKEEKAIEQGPKDEKEEKYHKLYELTKDLPKTKKMIGYKAVDHNYQAFYGDHPKYEIGQKYVIKGRLKPCFNGFHFCQSLKDVICLFPPQKGYHYLKVAGEVPIEYDLDDNGNLQEKFKSCASIMYQEAQLNYYTKNKWEAPFSEYVFSSAPPKEYFFSDGLDKKFVAYKMTILEEVPFSEFAEQALNEIITSEDEYYNTICDSQYEILLENKIINYSEGIFSNAFIHYWIYWVYLKGNHPSQDSCFECFRIFKEKFNAIKDENISQDIKVLFMIGPN